MSAVLDSTTSAQGAPPGPLREFWISFSANRGAVIGMSVVVSLLLVALLAPLLAPHLPDQTNSAAFLKPPAWQEGGSLKFLLGTDAIGRDILSRLIWGSRLSLSIGLGVVALSVMAGIAVGVATVALLISRTLSAG